MERLIKNVEELYEKETSELPRLPFDRHLYQRLLIEQGDNSKKMVPRGWKDSEKQFVQDLKDYCRKERLSECNPRLLRRISYEV